MELKITSPAFDEGGIIPTEFTCEGSDSTPPLRWESLPDQTKSLALLVEDLDSHEGPFTHWILFNLPPTLKGLDAAIEERQGLPGGSRLGASSFGYSHYGGPCPTKGEHRYAFCLFALDTMLDLPSGAAREDLLTALRGHVLAEGCLTGVYHAGADKRESGIPRPPLWHGPST